MEGTGTFPGKNQPLVSYRSVSLVSGSYRIISIMSMLMASSNGRTPPLKTISGDFYKSYNSSF